MAEPKTVLKIVCMHCGKDMGEMDGEGAQGSSSGICEDCWEEHYPQWPFPPNEEMLPVPPAATGNNSAYFLPPALSGSRGTAFC